MVRVTRTPRAGTDLDDIWLHIARDDPEAADRLVDRLVARCEELAAYPELGPARPDIAPDVRMLIEGDYLILYRIRDDGVDVVRIVHGARRLGRLFGP